MGNSVVQAEEPSLIGNTLGDRYRLIEVIGEGGMGRVYRAEQLATGKAVALKLLHPEFVGVDQVVQRFEREAKVTNHLSHPHIVNVIELGEWNGRLFLAMELLGGRTLAEVIVRDGAKSGGRLTIKRTLAIMRSVFDALEYLHDAGVVHRDLKPENIMVLPGGLLSRESIKLLDFGIAKLGDRGGDKSSAQLTQNGLVIGTPAYMSPEQASGLEADPRSDLYSCGVMLYHMLTGKQPFEGETAFDVLRGHISTPPRSLREVAAGAWIPDAMENLVFRAMAKRPADRFQSAREFRQALDHAAVVDYQTGASGVIPSPKRLSGGARFLCLAIVLAAGATLVGDRLRAARAAAASERAAAEAARAAAASAAREAQAAAEVSGDAPEQGRSSERAKRGVKHARTTSKRASPRAR